MNLGYAYTKGKLKEDMWSADGVYIIAPDGSKLPGLAEHTVNAMLENAYDMSNGWQWLNRLSAYYQSGTKNSISDTSERFSQKFGSFSVWDFNSNLAFGDWTIGLFAKNIFNTRGVTGIFKEQNMGTSPEQNYYGNGGKSIIVRPRTIGLSVTYDF